MTNEVKTAKAKARTLRISPRKLNLVAESIRGLKADKALAQLTFSTKRIADECLSCIEELDGKYALCILNHADKLSCSVCTHTYMVFLTL